MGRRSISGGVRPKGRSRIQFDFEYQGVRYRPAIDRIPTEANLRRARVQLQAINERIVKGTFDFAEEFPDYPFLAEIGAISARRTCNDVFDAFMSHAESRLAQNDLTFATVESYRKILDSVWRPAIGKNVFEDVKYSTLIQIVIGSATRARRLETTW